MKGAKPKSNAIRRGAKDTLGLMTSHEETRGVLIPYDIQADPIQKEIWLLLVPPVNTFLEQDIPMLKLLVFWYAIAEQAKQALASESGTLNILEKTGMQPQADNLQEQTKTKKNPLTDILKNATTEIRALSDQLGLSPLARSRIGLMDATTTKTAADTAAMFKSIDAAYDLPEAEIVDVS